MSEVKLVAESLQDFETAKPEELLLEGLSKKQKAKVLEIAKDELTADVIEANPKLIRGIMKSFVSGVSGKRADMAHKMRNKVLEDPTKYIKHIAPFVKVFAAKVAGKKGDLVFSYDPNQKTFLARLGNMQPGSTGVGGRKWSE